MPPAIVRYHWANPSSATPTTCIRVKHFTFTLPRSCIVKYILDYMKRLCIDEAVKKS
uniref:Uncharacterized protein n=1 Tax=Arundo donax TaxID=35708 RepID=A0A0A9E624_ARUDO